MPPSPSRWASERLLLLFLLLVILPASAWGQEAELAEDDPFDMALLPHLGVSGGFASRLEDLDQNVWSSSWVFAFWLGGSLYSDRRGSAWMASLTLEVEPHSLESGQTAWFLMPTARVGYSFWGTPPASPKPYHRWTSWFDLYTIHGFRPRSQLRDTSSLRAGFGIHSSRVLVGLGSAGFVLPNTLEFLTELGLDGRTGFLVRVGLSF